MKRHEIEEELDGLYKDLNFAYNADEETLCRAFNADSKQEYIKALTEEVDKYEALLEEYNLRPAFKSKAALINRRNRF